MIVELRHCDCYIAKTCDCFDLGHKSGIEQGKKDGYKEGKNDGYLIGCVTGAKDELLDIEKAWDNSKDGLWFQDYLNRRKKELGLK